MPSARRAYPNLFVMHAYPTLFVMPASPRFLPYTNYRPASGSEFQGCIPSRKPDPTALRHLMQTHGMNQNACLMICDRDIDLMAGRNAGIHTCLFDPECGQTPPPEKAGSETPAGSAPYRANPLLAHVEAKTGKQALLDMDGNPCPYNGDDSFSLDTALAEGLGFTFTHTRDWIFPLLDRMADSLAIA